MKALLVLAAFAVVNVSIINARAEEHPCQQARVGDWAWFTQRVVTDDRQPGTPGSRDMPWWSWNRKRVLSRAEEGTRAVLEESRKPFERRFEVRSRTNTKIGLSVLSREQGSDYETHSTLDLSDPDSLIPKDPSRPGERYVEVARGAENLKLAGKRYQTTWVEYESRDETSVGRHRVERTRRYKAWRARGVVPCGLVKFQDTYILGDHLTRVTVSELTMSGHGHAPSVPGER